MSDTAVQHVDAGAPPAAAPPARGRRPVWRALSVRNIGAVYVWILIVALFAVLDPSTFPTLQTAKSIVNQYSITGIVALSLVVPLAAGYYDLSIGYTMAFAGVFCAYLLQATGLSAIEAGALTILACGGIGLINFFVVGVLGVDSFIGTLGSGAVIGAITIAISDQDILISGNFSNLSRTQVGGLQLPVIYMIVLMVALGWWLERTASGRRLYAVGFDRETSRLTGLHMQRLAIVAFVTSATVAGFAGLLLAASTNVGSSDAGPSYLIAAFSAAFLGATQFRGGRFNPWGTVVAVLLLGTGNIGLLLIGGPLWAPMAFEGTVLIAAVALSGGQAASTMRSKLRRLRGPTDRVTAARGDGGPANDDAVTNA